MLNLSSAPGNTLAVSKMHSLARVQELLCAFCILCVSLDALEPDVACPVQPLQALGWVDIMGV